MWTEKYKLKKYLIVAGAKCNMSLGVNSTDRLSFVNEVTLVIKLYTYCNLVEGIDQNQLSWLFWK